MDKQHSWGQPIPYGRHHVTQEDIDAVVDVLQSDYLTQGPVVGMFEKAFAEYVGARYAVAVSSGTAALHLCTSVLDVKPGQVVVTTPITFSASANCVRYQGGEVAFADINPETWLLDLDAVRRLLESEPKKNFAGIIPVDFAGYAVDLEAFRELADEFGLWLIEDACHAPGGFFTDLGGTKQRCGNGHFADLAIFSFHPVKHMTTGEGGMVTTNDPVLYDRLCLLRTHGITRDQARFLRSVEEVGTQGQYPGWYMEMQELGFNYRLSDIQAALGLSQLRRAKENLLKRKKIAARYAAAFAGLPDIAAQSGVVEGHAYHLYVILTNKRFELYTFLKERNIYSQIHYIPVNRMPYYGKRDFTLTPAADVYYNQCISLPMYPELTEEAQSFVIHQILTFFESYPA